MLHRGFLQRFIASDAAKRLGLDFVAQRRLEIQELGPDFLQQSEGCYKESYTISESVIIGSYKSTDKESFKEVILEYRSYAHDLAVCENEEALRNLEQRTQQLAIWKGYVPAPRGVGVVVPALVLIRSVPKTFSVEYISFSLVRLCWQPAMLYGETCPNT
jgi:hypothetical protein